MAQAALCDITPQTRISTLLIFFCVHVLLLVGRCEFRPNHLEHDKNSVIPMPSLHIQRRLAHSVDGVSVWRHPACRATVQHHEAVDRPPPQPPPTLLAEKHHVIRWGDLGARLFTHLRITDKLWVWCPQDDSLSDLQELRCFGSILGFGGLTCGLRPPHFFPSSLCNTCVFPSCLMSTASAPCGMSTRPKICTVSGGLHFWMKFLPYSM